MSLHKDDASGRKNELGMPPILSISLKFWFSFQMVQKRVASEQPTKGHPNFIRPSICRAKRMKRRKIQPSSIGRKRTSQQFQIGEFAHTTPRIVVQLDHQIKMLTLENEPGRGSA